MIAAVFITLGQIALAVMIGDGPTLGERWSDGLFHWDSLWFYKTAEVGYFKPAVMNGDTPANFPFLPAYPLLSRWLSHASGLNLHDSMIVAAQLCCWGFWTFFLLLLHDCRASFEISVLAVGLIVLHPVSFFLIAAYSEPLFLFTMLGFIYWTERRGPFAFALAALFGFLMTATRFVGITLIVYPLFHTFVRRNWENNAQGASAAAYARAILLGAIAAVGLGSFFAYCQVRFGDWNLFSAAHRTGWGVDPDPLLLFDLSNFYETLTTWNERFLDPFALNAICAGYCVLMGIGVACAEIVSSRKAPCAGLGRRIGLYLSAIALFVLPYISHAGRRLFSFSRFSLPVMVLLVLAAAWLAAEHPSFAKRRWLIWGIGALLVLSAIANGLTTIRFTSGQWVA